MHYYQQVGRAGRAMDRAYGILLSGNEDDDITNYFIRTAFPPQAQEHKVLDVLNNAADGMTVPMIEQSVNMTRGQITKVLKILSVETPSPVVKRNKRWYATPVNYIRNEGKINGLIALRQAEQRQMREYMQSDSCLMGFLRNALDDPHSEPCGVCAPCQGQPLWPETYDRAIAKRCVEFQRHSELVITPRKLWPRDAFSTYGWRGRIKMNLGLEEGRALCLWGDAGWGEMVKQGKQTDGRFSNELVVGMTNMITSRWRPVPQPAWVTCVPSLNHTTLVPDFAQRLARQLQLPFVDCIAKTRPTPPQKEMMNSFQQANNLDGAFAISPGRVRAGPVLLVDDMVDSRWTFTVLAALLRQHGSGPVFPAALAMTTSGGG